MRQQTIALDTAFELSKKSTEKSKIRALIKMADKNYNRMLFEKQKYEQKVDTITDLLKIKRKTFGK